MTVRPLPDGDWLLLLDVELEPEGPPVTLGATAFGPVGVRMAKTIGVHDGGGRIRNSEGNVDEQGPNGAFRKRARWVDYSGPIAPGVVEGITLLDYPSNPNHPPPFHVRDDGWMGASPCLNRPITIEPGAAPAALWASHAPRRPRARDDRTALESIRGRADPTVALPLKGGRFRDSCRRE